VLASTDFLYLDSIGQVDALVEDVTACPSCSELPFVLASEGNQLRPLQRVLNVEVVSIELELLVTSPAVIALDDF